MKETEKIRVKVEIFGIPYTLITDASAIHIRKMAHMVDDLMTKNDQTYPRLEQSKLAVLTAIQIADERLQLEQELQQLKDAQVDPTQSQDYRKLQEEYNKLRADHSKLREEHTKLKQAYLEMKSRADRS